MSEVKLEKFVRRVTQTGAGYTKLVLVQVMLNGGESILMETPLTAQYGYEESKIKEMVADFMSCAQDDADGSTTPNTYCIKALKGIARGERSPKFRLRRESAEDGDEDLVGASEPATVQGLLAQLMRHLEADRRTSTIKDEIFARAMTQTIQSQAERIAHYEDKHWEVIQKMEELADEKEQREIARVQATGRERRLDEALKTFKPLVPVAIAKLKGIPESAKAGLQLTALKQVIKDLNPDQIEKVLEVLGPKAIALGELFLEANKDDVEAEEAADGKQPSTH